MTADSSEFDTALDSQSSPSLDRALWAATRPSLGEMAAGVACSVFAHLALAGALLAAVTLTPSPEPPRLLEIPVEIVVGSSVAEPVAMSQASQSAEVAPASADDDPSTQAAAEDEPGSEMNPASLPASAQDADPAAAREPPSTETPKPSALAAEPREPGPDLVPAGRVDPPSLPPLRQQRGHVLPPKLKRPAKLQRSETTVAPAEPGLKRTPTRREAAASRGQPSPPRGSQSAGRNPRALDEGRGAAAQTKAGMPRLARAGGGSSKGEQGGAAASPAVASYRGQVIAHLTRFKRYPLGAETRGAEGTPVVSFSLDGGGRVVAVALARSSGHADIDAETMGMVRRAVPFPAPPPGAPQTISAAISFQLR